MNILLRIKLLFVDLKLKRLTKQYNKLLDEYKQKCLEL